MTRWALLLLVAGALAPTPASAALFRYPLADPTAAHLAKRGDGKFFVIHVDHDPAPSVAANLQCLAFDGSKNFPNCYDAHDGTDYLLEGAFEAMDAGSLEVVAAADGQVVEAVDGHYDRCHADAASQGVSCDGNPIQPNYVSIAHADGLVTYYYHLKQGSVLVAPGQAVTCGQALGLVGSSGFSSTPHLHFQVETATGVPVDPYAGPASQPGSLWVVQDGPYGIPAAWCEGDEPQWPEAAPETPAEPVEVVETPAEAVEVPAEVVEASEVPGEVVEAVEPPAEVVEARVEVVDAAVDVPETSVDTIGAAEVSGELAGEPADDAEPGSSGALGCQATGRTRTGLSFLMVLALLGLSLLRARVAFGAARGRGQRSMGTNSVGPKTSR